MSPDGDHAFNLRYVEAIRVPGFGVPDLLTSAEHADTTGLRTNAAAAQLHGHLCPETLKSRGFPRCRHDRLPQENVLIEVQKWRWLPERSPSHRTAVEGGRIAKPISECEKQVYSVKWSMEDKMSSAVFCLNSYNLFECIFTTFYTEWHTCVLVPEPRANFVLLARHCWQYGGKTWPDLTFIIQFEHVIPPVTEINAWDLEVTMME